ncbi:MAG: SulP family inorganic anion transporter [Pseudohongiellaceae bacterium]
MPIAGSGLKGDVSGGVTAAVVALPLALAFGVASGLGALAGLYGAIIHGFIAAFRGGTPTQISGPTGPMTVVIAAMVVQFAGNLPVIFTIIMLSGLLQIIFGLAGFGRYIKLVPQPVVSGFMSGIGVIVIILQLAPLLGHVSPEGAILVKLMAVPEMLQDMNIQALILGLSSFLLVLLTPMRISQVLPSPLLAIIFGTLASIYFFPDVPVIGAIPQGLPAVYLPSLSLVDVPDVIRYALMLAFLGAIDSLLTSLVADSMTRSQHDSNRELIGQGTGNLVSGLFGGICGAGATMRTLVNIRAGGRSRKSGMIHSAALLLLVLAFADLASLIPLPVLAGILFKVGVDIVDWRNLKRLGKLPRPGVVIMLTTLMVTVFVDLMAAVAVGIVMASVLFVAKMADAQLQSARFSFGVKPELNLNEEEAAILDAAGERMVLFQVEGPLSFASARDIAGMLQKSGEKEVLLIDLTQVPFIDSSAAATLEQTTEVLLAEADDIVIFGANAKVMNILRKTDVVDLLGEDHFTASRLAAFRLARDLINGINSLH